MDGAQLFDDDVYSDRQHAALKSPISRNSVGMDEKTQYYLEDLVNPFHENYNNGGEN